jgi:hypothetical protein
MIGVKRNPDGIGPSGFSFGRGNRSAIGAIRTDAASLRQAVVENPALKHRVQWLRREQKRDQKLEARLPQRLKVIADEHHLEAVYLATSLASYSSIICLSGSGQRSAVASLRRAVRFAPGQCSISIS